MNMNLIYLPLYSYCYEYEYEFGCCFVYTYLWFVIKALPWVWTSMGIDVATSIGTQGFNVV